MAAIHGLLLTSWSAAGVTGPMAVAYLRGATGTYDAAFYVFTGLLVGVWATSLLMVDNMRRVHHEEATLADAGA